MLPFGFYRRRLLADAKLLGRWGEKRCRRFLRKKGFRIITSNYKPKGGEIDIVAAEPDGRIVFVEVKTRRDEKFAAAQSAVTPKKQKRMVIAARQFVRKYKLQDKPLRFDVVAVILGEKGAPEIRHYESAFRP